MEQDGSKYLFVNFFLSSSTGIPVENVPDINGVEHTEVCQLLLFLF